MQAHGDYKIELIDKVVHVYPRGGFNEEGIIAMHKEIAAIAPSNCAWALLEHPKNIAGLTPKAITEIIKGYQQLIAHNCVVIGLEISSAWQDVFEKNVIANVDLPIYLSSDVSALEKVIKEKLASKTFNFGV